jgi:hypothetical protein
MNGYKHGVICPPIIVHMQSKWNQTSKYGAQIQLKGRKACWKSNIYICIRVYRCCKYVYITWISIHNIYILHQLYIYIHIHTYIYKISSDSYHKSNDTCGYLQQVVPAMITLPYEIYPGTGLWDRSQMNGSFHDILICVAILNIINPYSTMGVHPCWKAYM